MANNAGKHAKAMFGARKDMAGYVGSGQAQKML